MILIAFMVLAFASIPAYSYRQRFTDLLGLPRRTNYRLLSSNQREELEIGTDAVEMSDRDELARPSQAT